MKTPISPGRSLRLMIVSLLVLPVSFVSGQTLRRIVSENGDPIRYPSYLTEYDGKLFFRANNLPTGNNVELWTFDGSVARMVSEINPSLTVGSDPSDLAVCNGNLYFCANNGTGSKLWQYNAASGAALAPGSSALASLPQEMFAYGGKLYFRATRFSDIGTELWCFNGTTQTPINMFPGTGSSYPQHFTAYNGMMFFNACGTMNQGTELWHYNGSGMPVEAARIYPNNGSSPENFGIFNGQLFFSADDGVHGRELWRYNGSQATLAADIVPGGRYSSSNPGSLTEFNGKLYFCATDEIHGYELWSFDGVKAAMVAEINPTPDPGNGDRFMMDSSPGNLTVFDGRLYFTAIDGTHGRELWSYDGITPPRMVVDLNPGQYGCEASELTVFGGTLYFSADDSYNPGLSGLQPAVFAMAAAPEVTLVLSIRPAGGGGFVLTLANSDGSPVTEERLAGVRLINLKRKMKILVERL
jgi:ELWxxDGT repeat protein